jgi:Tfp pilus assembly protein PilX
MTMSRTLRDERGVAMVYVMLVMMVMTSIAFVTLESIQHEQTTSFTQTNRQKAYQAAEAGIDDYMAKIKDDPQYYLHWIHPAESNRLPNGGSSVVPTAYSSGNPIQQAWTGTNVWTYPNGKIFVRTASSSSVPSGYEYNIQVTAPSAADPTFKVVSTGRPAGDTNTKDYRVVQEVLTPNSITRFYRIVNGDVGFGSTTTTQGMVWSNGNINHDGIAQANLYATGSITGAVTMQNGATKNQNQSPPINFSSFLASLSDIKRAASVNSPSTYFNDVTRDVWKIVFSSSGTYTAQACTLTDGPDTGTAVDPPAKTNPTTCATALGPYTVPSNGAIYSDQDVIVSGTVKGRVTVASNDDIILADALNPATAGTDVVGLDAQNDVIVATYAPSTLSWNASVLAQTGTWCSYLYYVTSSGGSKETCDTSQTQDTSPSNPTGSHTSMTFAGSSTTDDGGFFTMFGTRTYGYDSNLVFLQPPWFPSLVKPWTTTLFRELPAG